MVKTKTLADIQREIAELQRQAEALQATERNGVIERIKTAITQYDLKPSELFGGSQPKSKVTSTTASIGAAPASGVKKPRKNASSVGASPNPKPKLPMKYRDANGNAWSGHGKRPDWFKAAIASGMTAEQLQIS